MITSMTFRFGPQEGDTKVVRGVTYVRRQQRAYEGGRCVGRCVRRGRPVWEWVRADPQPEAKP